MPRPFFLDRLQKVIYIKSMLTKNQISEEVAALNKRVGITIKRLRETHGLQQMEIASEVSVVPNHISSIEKGHKGCDGRKLLAFAKLFNVTTDFLLTGNREGLSSASKAMLDGSPWFD